MTAPKVSVIIPAYNGAKFIGEAIQSVLGQTYSNVELIVVDDASPDETSEVVRRFDDARLKYIAHEKNKGSDAARDTGLRASCGEIVAFLDQDDLFHPQKLAMHVDFFASHPEIGVTYNGRFELNHSSHTVRDLYCPPRKITLLDLVLGFPLAPSDVVLKREWARRMDLLNGSLSWCGGEIVHYGGLFLDGCKFAAVNRALNYRRYHSERVIKDLMGGCAAEIYAQDKIFADPRCPPEVMSFHDIAHKNIYLIWAYRAFFQGEIVLGEQFLREAVRLVPVILKGNPCELATFLMMYSIDDESRDHEEILKRIFAQLPSEMGHISHQYDLVVARGYVIKGVRAFMWERPDVGTRYLEQAARAQVRFDDFFLSQLARLFLNYETEYGDAAVQGKIDVIAPHLEKLGDRTTLRRLIGCYSVNRAFQINRIGEYRRVLQMTLRAIASDPRYLKNRGVLSLLLRPLVPGGRGATGRLI